MNLKEGQPRPSRGRAKHRRRVLAEARREKGPMPLQTTIADIEQAQRRLEQVQRESARREISELSVDLEIVKKTVALGMEEVWLEFRLGRITQAERQSAIQRGLNTLEKEQPDIYNWLMGEDPNGETELARIRDRVFPPKRIGGYRVKR